MNKQTNEGTKGYWEILRNTEGIHREFWGIIREYSGNTQEYEGSLYSYAWAELVMSCARDL